MRLNIVGPVLNSLAEFAASSGSAKVSQITDSQSGGYCLDLTRSGAAANADVRGIGANGLPTFFNSVQTVFYRFWLKWQSLGSDDAVCNFQDTSGANKCFMHINGQGQLTFFDNSAALIATGATLIKQNTWTCIEAKIGTGASASWEFRINGKTEISGTNNCGSVANGAVRFGGNSPYTDSIQIRDIAVDDATFCGVGMVTCLNANAAGTDSGWTTGTGASDYTQVQDLSLNVLSAPDGDTTYVATSSSGAAFTTRCVSTGALNLNGPVATVKVLCLCKDSGSTAMHARMRSGTGLVNGTDGDPGTTGYALMALIQNTDPANGQSWTLAGVDGVEVGMVNSTASQARLTFAAIAVDYSPALTNPDGKPVVTGQVTLTDNGNQVGSTQVLINGQTFFTNKNPSLGSHSVTASYAAQGQFATAQASQTYSVGGSSTATTTVINNGSPINANYGSAVSVPVNVTPANAVGSVTLTVDGVAGTPKTLDGTTGALVFSVTGLSVGNHTLSAAYTSSAPSSFSNSSGTGSILVIGIGTQTTIPAVTSVPAGSALSVTVNVSATSGSAAPTGTVVLQVDGVAQPGNQTLTPVTGQTALSSTTFSVPGLAVGSHTLLAIYTPAANTGFNASQSSGTDTGTINGLPVTVTVQGPSSGNVNYGTAAQIVVTVAQQSGTTVPSGTVTLTTDGQTSSAQTLPLPTGGNQVTFTLPTTLAVGSHTCVAQYKGDNTFNTGSGQTSFNVLGSLPTISFTFNPASPISYGTADTLTVTVAANPSSLGTPGGTVSLTVDGASFGTPQTLQNGTASFALGSLNAGTHTIVATYSGGGQFVGTTGTASLTVSGQSTTTKISPPSQSVQFGQAPGPSITVTVTSP